MSLSLQPYVRSIAIQSKHVRTYAAAAKQRLADEAKEPFKPREEIKTSKVNGITVASVETNQPISKLAVYFRAGSRFETDSTQGLVHMLRVSAGLGTSGASQFGITRSIEAVGGNLSCTSAREYIAYTLEATRDKISSVDKYLQDVAVNQVFKPWELTDNVGRLRLERAIRPPEVRVLELIHKSAFRKGLGYSIYSPKWMLGNHSSEMLSGYVKSNFGDNASVVAIGMPHEQAVDFASRLNLKGGGAKVPPPATYYPGSDIRKETNDSLAYVALAVKGQGIGNKALAVALVHRALGSKMRTTGGVVSNSKLMAAVGEKEVEATASGFSAMYADIGLVGAYISASPKNIDSITRKAADILRNTKFTEADATRAKGIMQGDLALGLETDTLLLQAMGVQTLLTGSVPTLAEQLKAIQSITADDMNAVLKDGKLSMAAYGNVANVPYLDQLK